MDKKFLVVFAIVILECLVVAIICSFLPKWITFILAIINGPLCTPLLDYIDDAL